MIEILAFLLSVLPQCPTEDSEWCVWESAYINTGMQDPAPFTFQVGKVER